MALGERSLAGIVDSVAFTLVLLPSLAAALQALGLDAVTRLVSQWLDAVIGLIPKLVSATVVLGLAALIGQALADIVSDSQHPCRAPGDGPRSHRRDDCRRTDPTPGR